jgi:heavy metal translocating P-type ATPase
VAKGQSESTNEPPTARTQTAIAAASILGIIVYLACRWFRPGTYSHLPVRLGDIPLLLVLFFGGGYLVVGLLAKVMRGEFGSDLLAGISIVTSVILEEYLAGSVVVLMLAGGEALEAYAVRRASSALAALARRLPSVGHRSVDGKIEDVPLDAIRVGDLVVVFPHETCPVDGVVVTGHGTMDESYLTGEPFLLDKAPGSHVLSGAINGATALSIRSERLAIDSRYAKIMQVMQESEQRRPRLRRLGDRLGALYTPLAVVIAIVAWLVSREPVRFLAVLVVATPCPLLIAIPVAIIGAISLAARRGIVIRDPALLEVIGSCRVAIFDKTGTLTYGRPVFVDLNTLQGFARNDLLQAIASIERYSRHPLAGPIVEAARKSHLALLDATEVSEPPGQGLVGTIAGRVVRITGRSKLTSARPELANELPPSVGGLECVVLIDERLAGVARFRDQPRKRSRQFIRHLHDKHGFQRVLLVSGDRDSEARYLAESVGITEVYAGQSPEQKVEIVRRETMGAKTVFVGDGVNDAPAIATATVGLAFGRNSDVAAEAAGAVILDADLVRVDEFLHIGQRLRRITYQSAVGGIVLSFIGMLLAAAGFLPPVAGAVMQEVIDVAAVLNALRTVLPTDRLTDY